MGTIRAFFVLILVLSGFVFLPEQVMATDPPDSISFQYTRAFRNLAETGDLFVLFHARIAYSPTYPPDLASDTIVFRMFSGSTLLAVACPYVYSNFENNGYGDIISGFYFSANTSPAWGGEYRLNIQGVPTYFGPEVTKDYYMNTADYSTAVNSVDSKADLYNSIITLCNDFGSIYPDIDLKVTMGDSITLSSYGEAYFRGAIQGIQTMCPQLFYIMTYVPQEMDVDPAYDLSLRTQYNVTLDTPVDTGTSDLKRGANRLGNFFGVAGSFILGFIVYIGCLLLCIEMAKKQHGLEAGLFVSTILMVGAAIVVGEMVFSVLMIFGVIAVIGIFYTQMMKRAA